MIVYKITNTINNKVYIGITKCSLSKRWKEHKSASKKSNLHLYVSIRKYGLSNFKIEQIYSAKDENDMYNQEIKLIAFYKANNPKFGYNNSIGGEKSSLGKKLTDIQKKAISGFQKNRKRKPHSDETKKKMSESAKGRDMSKFILKSVEKRKGLAASNRVKINQYTLSGEFICAHNSLTEAANSVNGTPSAFGAIKRGRLKTYKNYIWKYEN